jgi:hypothetical protein
MIQSYKNLIAILLCLIITGCSVTPDFATTTDCITANNNLITFVDQHGTFADKIAQLFEIYPVRSSLLSIFLSIIGLILLKLCNQQFNYISERKKEQKIRTISIKIETAQDVLSAIQTDISTAKKILNTLEANKITVEEETNRLVRYLDPELIKSTEDKIKQLETQANIRHQQLMIELNQKETELNDREEKINKRSKEIETLATETEAIRRSLWEI